MTDPLATHELAADSADEFMAIYADTCEALNRLRDAARDISCPGCDPTGERADQVRDDLRERYALVFGDADMFLGFAADTRNALRELLMPSGFYDCDHDEDEPEG